MDEGAVTAYMLTRKLAMPMKTRLPNTKLTNKQKLSVDDWPAIAEIYRCLKFFSEMLRLFLFRAVFTIKR